MQFLLIIPAFNEARRLPLFLPFLAESLKKQATSVRLLVVDDGSEKSESAAMHKQCEAAAISSGFPVEYLRMDQNVGKGGAIYGGWANGKEEPLLAFVDADGSIAPEEICRVLEQAAQSPESAHFASRVKMRGKHICRSEQRHLIGRIFATLVGHFIDPGVYDTQCGLKIIPAAAYEKIAPLLQERGFVFDVELLAALNHVGCPVIEHPIDWKEVSGSKVSLFSDSLRMMTALFTIDRRRKAWKRNSSLYV
ncbi:MAG: glycosyltransferase [Chthoniobacterales bacterium]